MKTTRDQKRRGRDEPEFEFKDKYHSFFLPHESDKRIAKIPLFGPILVRNLGALRLLSEMRYHMPWNYVPPLDDYAGHRKLELFGAVINWIVALVALFVLIFHPSIPFA